MGGDEEFPCFVDSWRLVKLVTEQAGTSVLPGTEREQGALRTHSPCNRQVKESFINLSY